MVALLSNGIFHYKWLIFDRTQIQQTKLKVIYNANIFSLSCPSKITWTGIASICHRPLLFLSLSESPDNMWKTVVMWEIILSIQYAMNQHAVCPNTNKVLLTFSLSKTYSKVNNCLVSRALEISMWVGFSLFIFFFLNVLKLDCYPSPLGTFQISSSLTFYTYFPSLLRLYCWLS